LRWLLAIPCSKPIHLPPTHFAFLEEGVFLAKMIKLNLNKWVNAKIYFVKPTLSVYNNRTLLGVIGMIGSLFGKDSN
ncbi:hypothetical protein, partial [Bacillus cereus]|uniref:hypothetical protein n=1 Tax=Bacillus cereus TaxID=1396 RepID=UPI001C3DA8FE